MPPAACSLLFHGRSLGYPETALIHPACLPWQQHTSLEKKLESEHKCGWKGRPKSLIWQPRGNRALSHHRLDALQGARPPLLIALYFGLLWFFGLFLLCLSGFRGMFGVFVVGWLLACFLQSFVFIFVTIWWKCSCCGERWFWPHVSSRHNECSKAVLVGEGITGAAGAGPTQASLGWGWRWPLFGFFDLKQDLISENKMENMGSASLFTRTVREEQRKGNRSRGPKPKIIDGTEGWQEGLRSRNWTGSIGWQPGKRKRQSYPKKH